MEPEDNGIVTRGFWTKFGIVLVALMLGVSVYSTLELRADIRGRRVQFCDNTNREHRNQLNFWNEILVLSAAQEEEAYVVVGERRFRVVFEEPNEQKRIEDFGMLKARAFPIVDCSKAATETP